MAKIRVADLARNMGLDHQDLVFKLKSIGVRVEGEEAQIDTDIIKAILQGKRLPQPREVILRDDSEEAAAPQAPAAKPVAKAPPLRRPAGARPRRSMIQKVEPRIRELEIPKKGTKPAEEAAAAEQTEVRELVIGEDSTKVEETAPVKAETQDVAAKEAEANKAQAEKAEAEKAAAENAEAEKTEAKKADAVKAKAEKTAAEKAEAKKAETKKAETKEAEPKKIEAKKVEPKKIEAKKVGAKRVEARKPEAKKPAAAAGSKDRRRRSDRPSGGRRLARLISKGPTPEKKIPKTPVSERGKRRAKRREEESPQMAAGVKFKGEKPSAPVIVSEGMTVREFAEKLDVKVKDLIKALVMRGVMANINHVLDLDTAKSLAEELGVDVMEVTFEEEVQLKHEEHYEGEEVRKEMRAPVVTVMGHVDHGKTTLLDYIRKASVAEGEAGGITQHIGSYRVDLEDQSIVFLDTPGHEAFTMMRARGAGVTDIVILVVAADDSVMPQTIEAINHARAANVPIVVAINKVDKANANVDRVKKELADQNLLVEDWGGDTVAVPLSAKEGTGVDTLLEMILLTADLLELKAAHELPANGVVLEARKETGRGIVANVLVQSGTLRVGDVFVAGSVWGRVRLMTDDRGQRLETAGPSTPLEITGFTEVPGAGDLLQVMKDESRARSIAEHRRVEDRQRELRPQTGKLSLEQLFDQMEKEEIKELPVVVKADVDGSAEVLRDTLQKLSTEKVVVKIIHMAVGAISTNDVLLASASNAIIIGFNVRPERNATALAEKEEVDVRLHTVIYELIDELKKAMAGLLEPLIREVHSGTAEVRDTFKVPKAGVIAGCHVTDGVIPRNAKARLLRDNVVVWEGKLSSLKRFKDDASEVRSGFDCGIGLERFQDIKPGDEIEAYTQEEVAPTL